MPKRLERPPHAPAQQFRNYKSSALAEDPRETARYIGEFATELSSLARQAKLDLLAYLLDMARLEAMSQERRNSSAGGSTKK